MKNLRLVTVFGVLGVFMFSCSAPIRSGSNSKRKTKITGVDPKVTTPSKAVINATGDGLTPGINSANARGIGSEPNARAIADQAIARLNNGSAEGVVKVNPNPDVETAIQAGRSIGRIHVNQNAEEVIRLLGKPKSGDAAMGKAVSFWEEYAVYTVRDTGAHPIARVKEIRVATPGFKSSKGIGVGSGLANIQKAYKVSKSESYQSSGKSFDVYSDPSGIAFEIDATGTCVAVIVFPSGKQPSSYLKLRPGN